MNVEIMTLAGTQRVLDETTVAGLRSRVRGPVLTAADAGYDAARQIWDAIRLRQDHSPVSNRDAVLVINIAASWERAEDDAANIEWARATWQDLRRFSTGGTYVNFLTEEEGDERIRVAYGKHYDRLVEIRTRWDPGNLFRTNKNIAPRAA